MDVTKIGRIVTCGAVLAAALAMAQTASADPAGETVTQRIGGGDLHPATDAGAQRLLYRIEQAALEVCGASPASLHELRLAARHSECFRRAVEDAVAQTADPKMTEALHREDPSRP
jgi:UrcA family protein